MPLCALAGTELKPAFGGEQRVAALDAIGEGIARIRAISSILALPILSTRLWQFWRYGRAEVQ